MKKFLLLIISIPLFAAAVIAQSTVIKGKVTDSSGTGLKGINVVSKGAVKGTQTDADGNFSITVISPNASLTFSSIGYKTRILNASANIAVILTRDVQVQEEVVVNVGYGSIKRRELSSAVSAITAKDLKDIPINSAAEALNGRLAGVTATTAEGSPDAEVRIRVRGGMSITGDNTPLYIVDGVQVENGLSAISPQDIQDITVLKDASVTAIYGARGANGVIIITTKSGRPGKLKVNYNGFVGVKYLPQTLKVLSPYDFIVYQSERSRGSSTDSTTFTKNFGTTWDTLSNYRNVNPVDWQDEVFGRTAITTTQNISLNGGNNKITYNFGYTYNNEQAIVLNSQYKRHLLNLKTDYKITKKIKVGVTTRYTYQDVYGAGVSDTKGSSYNRLRNAVKYRPFLSGGQDIDDSDPFADPNAGNGLNLVNPIALANAEFRRKSTDVFNVTANLNYNITKKLSFKSTFGFDRRNFDDRQFSDSITPYSIIAGSRKPIVALDTNLAITYTNSNVFTYSLKNLGGKHDLDILLGEETYDLRNTTNSSLFGQFPLNTDHGTAFSQTTLGSPFAGYPRPTAKTRYTSLSFFTRLNYVYNKKYVLSFNMRADGASKFAPEDRWGYFPGGSFAWLIKNEKFMKNVNAITALKLRAGFGAIGNNRIGDYLYLPTFFNDNRLYYGINNQAIYAYYPNSLPNPTLQWEAQISRNIGLDVSLFNRIDFSFDAYSNTSSQLLLNKAIAATYGYDAQVQNAGKTSNKGIEFQLSALVVKKKNFTWNSSFNMSFNKNRVESLGAYQSTYFPPASWGVSGQPSDYILRIGDPVGAMWGLVTDGFYTVNDFNYNPATSVYTLKAGVVNNSGIIGTIQPGSIKFKDLNGDSVVDLNNDRKIIGNPNPKFTGGWNNSFTYKQWDASIFVNFSYGNDVYNANKIEFTNGYTNNANLLDIMAGRWKVVTATGQTAQYVNGSGQVVGIAPDQLTALNAGATIWQPLKASGAFYPHSWAIEDGSFLRINNITVGYKLPVKSLLGLRMSQLRFYATANNLAVLTSYSGYDPEVSVRSSGLTPGLDYSAYPKSRSFIFGINASF